MKALNSRSSSRYKGDKVSLTYDMRLPTAMDERICSTSPKTFGSHVVLKVYARTCYVGPNGIIIGSGAGVPIPTPAKTPIIVGTGTVQLQFDTRTVAVEAQNPRIASSLSIPAVRCSVFLSAGRYN